MIKIEKRISIGIIVVLIVLGIASIAGAIIIWQLHPAIIGVVCAIMAFVMYNEDIKKA